MTGGNISFFKLLCSFSFLLFSVGAYTCSVTPVSAAVKSADEVGEGALNFVDNMGQRALSFLSSEDMTQKQKAASFSKLLRSSYDLDTIGRFALGRYWRTATKKERKEYLKLFKKMVIGVYSQRFQGYSGQKFEARNYRPDGTKDTIVTSFIVPESGAEIEVDWRVRYKKGRYQIVDVIVEGVSMSLTQRSDFSSVIQRGGGDIQILLDHLGGS